MRCFTYSSLSNFNIKSTYAFLSKNHQVTKYNDVYHIKMSDKSEFDNEGDVFIFPYGALVTWGLTDEQEDIICNDLMKFTNDPTLHIYDDDLYTYGYETDNSIKDDHITVDDNDILKKLACSFALAQSAKLGAFENSIRHTINATKDLPEQLAKNGKIHLSAKEIRKIMGRIFIDRSSINLYIELLDTPNFFWDKTELEPFYEMLTEYVDQEGRLKIINTRLDLMRELMEMLVAELNNQHSSKLEWIIIILIFIEVTVTFAKEVFHIL
ncbi:MAG: sporulation protein RMD1 [Francisellaceae bacterium]|jgi:uncharacterized Rmd1/YagE family protein|nr:sporulation protein RMD1 [Francisellaceae bacterium]